MTVPPEILTAYRLDVATVRPITVGNINQTFRVGRDTHAFILQRLNPIFSPLVHHDIEAVTNRLAAEGMTTPRLVPNERGDLWTEDAEGNAWRLQTLIEGVNHSAVRDPNMVRSAGALLGRFHRALLTLEHTFRARRVGVHDTPRHVAHLREALATTTHHPAHAEANAIAQQILSGLAALPPLPALPERVVHGDPKLNNMMFDRGGTAICLIDLDTVAAMALPLELGDALRSWCNPVGEDETEPRFDLGLFAAALEGYGSVMGGLLSPEEIENISVGVETICLELAARFCRDILEERYFGWDRSRYSHAWQHHRDRAQGQLKLAQSFAQIRDDARQVVRRVFAEPAHRAAP